MAILTNPRKKNTTLPTQSTPFSPLQSTPPGKGTGRVQRRLGVRRFGPQRTTVLVLTFTKSYIYQDRHQEVSINSLLEVSRGGQKPPDLEGPGISVGNIK